MGQLTPQVRPTARAAGLEVQGTVVLAKAEGRHSRLTASHTIGWFLLQKWCIEPFETGVAALWWSAGSTRFIIAPDDGGRPEHRGDELV